MTLLEFVKQNVQIGHLPMIYVHSSEMISKVTKVAGAVIVYPANEGEEPVVIITNYMGSCRKVRQGSDLAIKMLANAESTAEKFKHERWADCHANWKRAGQYSLY